MTGVRTHRLTTTPEGGPHVLLLDASGGDVDPDQLRQQARQWPEASSANFASRAYRFPLALVAWHHEPVGIDIERIDPYDEDFCISICTHAERATFSGVSDPAQHQSSLWCSKEALAKALGDAIRYRPQQLESPLRWPEGRSGRWRAQELAAPEGHVAWVCWQGIAP